MFTNFVRVVSAAGVVVLGACASASKFQGMDAEGIFRLAQEEFERENYGDAAETLDRLLLAYPTFSQAPAAHLLLGDAYFRDEQYITASSEYGRFLDRYPAHPEAPKAALGVCRSFAELSPISQRDQSYTQQAVATCLNVVADFPGAPEAGAALEVATAMRTKLARKAYENGSFYLRRDLNDSAVIYFESVVREYPETEWAPRALLGIIEAYREIGYDDEVADARNRLLTRYPDSPEARSLGEGGVAGVPGSGPQ
ncbi:MAG: outer membrane protein assembly factor BamD [Longimicrobiales bacterium]|nr:outer membrane protein assembly factor BamD [Longimicrobiales bacterium]